MFFTVFDHNKGENNYEKTVTKRKQRIEIILEAFQQASKWFQNPPKRLLSDFENKHVFFKKKLKNGLLFIDPSKTIRHIRYGLHISKVGSMRGGGGLSENGKFWWGSRNCKWVLKFVKSFRGGGPFIADFLGKTTRLSKIALGRSMLGQAQGG